MADQDPQTPAPPVETPVEPTPQAQPQYATVEQFKNLERALTTIAQHLSQAAPAQAPAPQSPDDLKDDELWGLAQQGNRQAFEMYQSRIAQRETRRMMGQQAQDQTVLNQLTALYQKYPELGDPQHPLTQRAVAFKGVLMQMGSANNRQTDLDAILRAVADSRDVISPRTASPARQATPTGQMGAMHRQADSTSKDEAKVTPEGIKLAKQMGVKDPGKAIKKFWERNDNGTSRVSPNIAAAIDRQG